VSPSPIPLQPPVLEEEPPPDLEDDLPQGPAPDWFLHPEPGGLFTYTYHKPGEIESFPSEGGEVDEGGGDLVIPPPGESTGDGKPYDGF
jgi:hypothetical protein